MTDTIDIHTLGDNFSSAFDLFLRSMKLKGFSQSEIIDSLMLSIDKLEEKGFLSMHEDPDLEDVFNSGVEAGRSESVSGVFSYELKGIEK